MPSLDRQLLADNVLHHLLVQQQVGHQFLQLAILILQLINRFISNGINPAYFLLAPVVKGRLRNPRLAAGLANDPTVPRLLQNKGYLRLQKPQFFYRCVLSPSRSLNWDFPG